MFSPDRMNIVFILFEGARNERVGKEYVYSETFKGAKKDLSYSSICLFNFLHREDEPETTSQKTMKVAHVRKLIHMHQR